MFNPLTTSIEYVSRAGKLRALAVTTMSRAALLQRPSMQSPKSDQALTALCAGCSFVRSRLGVFPIQRLRAWVNALESLNPSSHAILDYM